MRYSKSFLCKLLDTLSTPQLSYKTMTSEYRFLFPEGTINVTKNLQYEQ